MTAPFADGARMMAEALGVGGYRFAVIDHPISSADDAGLAARAVAAFEQATSLLFAPDRG